MWRIGYGLSAFMAFLAGVWLVKGLQVMGFSQAFSMGWLAIIGLGL